MTAQIHEKLHLNGETLALCSEPLGDYFAVRREGAIVAEIVADGC